MREICHAFDLNSVAVLAPTRDGWETIARAGSDPPRRPSQADMEIQLSHGAVVVLKGDLGADDQRLLSAFVTQLRSAQEQAMLEDRARDAEVLRSANEVRDGLLMAVSHDLRTPLSTIKLSAASLVSEDVRWTDEQVREFAQAIEADADRLNCLVSEVLDVSRLQSGALGVHLEPTDLASVICAAVNSVPHDEGRVITTVSPPAPVAEADRALLERVVANLVANAMMWSPDRAPVHVHAGSAVGGVEIRVVDRGPGIAPSERLSVFQPFQRLGDGDERERDRARTRARPCPGLRRSDGWRDRGGGYAWWRNHDGGPTRPSACGAIDCGRDAATADNTRCKMTTRVLLVDDHTPFVAAFRTNLCARGYEVIEARPSGRRSLDSTRRRPTSSCSISGYPTSRASGSSTPPDHVPGARPRRLGPRG